VPAKLSEKFLNAGAISNRRNNEGVWIKVIQKMDDVYTDLIHYQVELEKKNADMEEARQFIRSVLASMTDVLIVCDLNGAVQQSNRALSELNGKPEDALTGTHLSSLFDGESSAIIGRVLETNRSGRSGEYEMSALDASGKGMPLVIRCSPQFDHDGALFGMVLIGRPVGELRQAYNELNHTIFELQQAQQHLVQSEKMASLGRLVAGVAHELNNPISFIHSNMFTIKKYGYRLCEYITSLHNQLGDEADNPLRKKLKINHILDDIPSLVDGGLEGAERVSKVVQDLRRFSTSHREDESEFDLVESVKKAAMWVLQTSRIQAELVFVGESLMISNFEGFIHQVIVNLIQNAMDSMEDYPRPKVEIHCWQDGDHAKISVRDHGTGILEEDIIRVFDPFFTTKEIGKGTGLGLYVSYGLIVDQCGGQMTVDNHPDGGAVFSIVLPISRGGDNHHA